MVGFETTFWEPPIEVGPNDSYRIKRDMNNCCITPSEKKEAVENLNLLFQASQQAALTAPQHEGIKAAAQKIAAILDKTQSLTANLQESEVISCPSKSNNND